jgi:hypothetical protein
MDGIAFLNELAGGKPVGGAYYFCGEDPYSLNKGVRALVERTNPDCGDEHDVSDGYVAVGHSGRGGNAAVFDVLRVVVARNSTRIPPRAGGLCL